MTSRARPIWLVGANGMLARALRRRLETAGLELRLSDRELDIGDAGAVLDFAQRETPQLIVNAAAYTRVDDAETDRDAAFRVNAEGPAHLARAAKAVGARLLHFSTDYVFDGNARVPYVESAPTAPQGVYGKSKLLGEERALSELPLATFVVRTSWLFGVGGANFVKTMLGLLRTREELRVVDDQRGRPTYTEDLAAAALGLVGLDGILRDGEAASGVYHFANSENVTWYGLCLAIRETLSGLGETVKTRRIVPVSTLEFPRPAPRPAYSVLATSKLEGTLKSTPRSYRAALDEYVREELENERRPEGRS
jgi:dTDP-4-dehydrorhamnose reductase